jgi:hypothetical protein
MEKRRRNDREIAVGNNIRMFDETVQIFLSAKDDYVFLLS